VTSGRGLVVAAGLALCAALGLGGTGGCKGNDTTPTDGGQGGGGGGTPADKLSARDFYLQFVHTELDLTCGICHAAEDPCVPTFMAETAEGSYLVLKDAEGVVTHSDNSNLIYHGAHTGPALTEFQEDLVRQWLDKEFADDDDPPSPTLSEALLEIGDCMQEADFMDNKVYLLAYQQSNQGPCGSCHRTGEAGTWIGYNEQEMYDKNTRLPWIKRLVKPSYDGDNRFNDLVPSHRFVEKVESASACNTPHASGLIDVDIATSIDAYVTASLDRWRSGTCEP
jgi:hypothetical protein